MGMQQLLEFFFFRLKSKTVDLSTLVRGGEQEFMERNDMYNFFRKSSSSRSNVHNGVRCM